jgi:hypothetical protein
VEPRWKRLCGCCLCLFGLSSLRLGGHGSHSIRGLVYGDSRPVV